MYGRWWTYYAAAQSPCWIAEKHEVAFDSVDDLWIFVRLALVLAAFSAGLACILWIAG